MTEDVSTLSGDGTATPEPEAPSQETWAPPTLLSDAPATSDEFGGGHARLARSLAGTIRDEEGGRAIALTGSYGSGKSTVVQLAEAELQSEDVAVFTFDAWAHSGDPLRRSFVEELVEDLHRRRWTAREDWEDDLLRLSRQRETTSIKSSPTLTLAGVLLALALLLVPLGTAMLAKNEMGADRGIAGLVLLILPLVVVIGSAFWRRWKKTGSLLGDLVPLLVRDRQLETTTTTIRTPDPTTVEFESVFRRIVGAVLNTPSRKLVIVVDNLDRLLPDEATAAWSVMRTFLDGAARTAWERRFWVVAPLDLDGLAVRSSSGDAEVTRRPEDDLITKTFAATLRVPPPVLSEWRDFFDSQLREAFPFWSRRVGELRAVYDLFLRLRVAGNGPPTPRAVKSFVNRLAGLDRQWRGDIPLRTLALYTLVENSVSPDGAQIGTEGFVSDDVESIVGDEWRRDLAAVHFNVEPEKSIQVLVGGRVETALETGDAERLREVAGTAGIGEAVLDVVRSAAPTWSITQMSTAAATLASADFERTPGLDGAWAVVGREAVRRRGELLKGDIDLSSSMFLQGLAKLVREVPSDLRHGVTVTLARALSGSGSLSVSTDPEQGTATPAQWAQAARELVEAVGSGDDGALRRLSVPAVDADGYLSTLSVLAKTPEGAQFVAKHARPGGGVATPEAVVDALVAHVENETFAEAVGALGVLPYVTDATGSPFNWKWDDLVVALQQAVDPDHQSVGPEEVGALVNGLLRLKSFPAAKTAATKALSALAPDSLLRQLAAHADETSAAGPVVVALLLNTVHVKKPAVEPTPTTAGNQRVTGYQTFASIRSAPSQHEDVVRQGSTSTPPSAIRELARRVWVPKSDKSLVGAVLLFATERTDADVIFDLETLLVAGEHVRLAVGAEWFGDTVSARVGEVLRNGGVPVGIRTLHPTAFDAVTASLSSEDARTYRRDVLAKYTEFDRSQWDEIVTAEWPRALALAIRLAEEGDRVGAGAELSPALFDLVSAVIDETRESIPEGVEQLYLFLPQRAREGFLSHLRASVLDAGLAGLRVALAGPYGNDLALADDWARNGDRVVTDFLPGIVDRGRGDEVSWVAALLESSGLLSSTDRGLNAALLDRVEGRYKKSNTSGVVKRGLARIENTLRAHVPKSRRKKKGLARLAEEAKAILFGSTTTVPQPKAESSAPDEPDDAESTSDS